MKMSGWAASCSDLRRQYEQMHQAVKLLAIKASGTRAVLPMEAD
jgi:hypothetical protein